MSNYTGTVPTFLAGELADADKFDEMTDLATALTDQWTDYSSSLVVTGSVSNPSKGNSTYKAKYKIIGDTFDFRMKILIGSTWAVGSGDYRFSLPFSVSADSIADEVGIARLLDAGVNYYPAMCHFQSATTLEIIKGSTAIILGSAGPGTAWAVGDEIRAHIRGDLA